MRETLGYLENNWYEKAMCSCQDRQLREEIHFVRDLHGLSVRVGEILRETVIAGRKHQGIEMAIFDQQIDMLVELNYSFKSLLLGKKDELKGKLRGNNEKD